MAERVIARRVSATALVVTLMFLMIDGTLSNTRGGVRERSEASSIDPTSADSIAPDASGQQQEPNKYLAEVRKQIAGKENEPAETVFKNIQLLKGMPAGRLLSVMNVAFNRGLGVDCTHCHVEGQWDKEDKETKQIARNMWNFMRKVNDELKQAVKERPNAFVNCTTCHRGQPNPNAPPKK